MKKSNFLLVALVTFSTLAKAQKELFHAKIDEKAVPEKIWKALDRDFKDVKILKYEGLPITMIDGQIYVDSDENTNRKQYEDYVVTLVGKSGVISATYDAEGKLISTFEKLKNTALPGDILATIGRDFPGWAVKGDKVRMRSYRDGMETAHYKIWLQKNGMQEEVVLDETGKVLRQKSQTSNDNT